MCLLNLSTLLDLFVINRGRRPLQRGLQTKHFKPEYTLKKKPETRMTASIRMQTHKRLIFIYIYYDTDNTMQIFREIPFFRPQNET